MVSLSPSLLGAEANLETSCLVLCCRCCGQAFLQPSLGLAVLFLLPRSLQRGFSLEPRHLKYEHAGENERTAQGESTGNHKVTPQGLV